MTTSSIQKIFGVSGPSGSISAFGSLKTGNPTYTTDLDDIQTSEWSGGLSSSLINDNKPTLQDLNSIFYALTYQNVYFQQLGISEWNSETEYFIGSFVTDGASSIYMSRIDNNIDQPLTDETKWYNFNTAKTTKIGATNTYTVLNSDHTLIWSEGAAQAGATITLPAPTSELKNREIIIKYVNGSGGVDISIVCESPGFVFCSESAGPGGCHIHYQTGRRFICDGVNWFASPHTTAAD